MGYPVQFVGYPGPTLDLGGMHYYGVGINISELDCSDV